MALEYISLLAVRGRGIILILAFEDDNIVHNNVVFIATFIIALECKKNTSLLCLKGKKDLC